MDNMGKADRSRTMSKIRSSETLPERTLRSILHRFGYRFRKNDRRLPGAPDIVLPKYRTVIYVHGCFWHQHEGCPWATMPKANKQFWLEKFEKTKSRDAKNIEMVRALGWKAIEVWECEVARMGNEIPPKILHLLEI